VRSFGPYKAPGKDGLYPVQLQYGLEILMPYLVNMFSFSLSTGYIPLSMRGVKVKFIPKPGKDTSVTESLQTYKSHVFLIKMYGEIN
jgi:hypothetical protein